MSLHRDVLLDGSLHTDMLLDRYAVNLLLILRLGLLLSIEINCPHQEMLKYPYFRTSEIEKYINIYDYSGITMALILIPNF